MEGEPSKISLEEERLQILAELDEIRKKGVGDSNKNNELVKRYEELEKRLFEIEPPPV